MSRTEAWIPRFCRCTIYNDSFAPGRSTGDKADSQRIKELAFRVANKSGPEHPRRKQFMAQQKRPTTL